MVGVDRLDIDWSCVAGLAGLGLVSGRKEEWGQVKCRVR